MVWPRAIARHVTRFQSGQDLIRLRTDLSIVAKVESPDSNHDGDIGVSKQRSDIASKTDDLGGHSSPHAFDLVRSGLGGFNPIRGARWAGVCAGLPVAPRAAHDPRRFDGGGTRC